MADTTTVDLRGIFLPRDRGAALIEVTQNLYDLFQEMEARLGRYHYLTKQLAEIIDQIERS